MIFDTMATSQRKTGLIRCAPGPTRNAPDGEQRHSARPRASRAINIAWADNNIRIPCEDHHREAKITIVKQCMKKETPNSNHQYVKEHHYRVLLEKPH
jgi:hypothetical protein